MRVLGRSCFGTILGFLTAPLLQAFGAWLTSKRRSNMGLEPNSSFDVEEAGGAPPLLHSLLKRI